MLSTASLLILLKAYWASGSPRIPVPPPTSLAYSPNPIALELDRFEENRIWRSGKPKEMPEVEPLLP
jgi:hypothetical protein